ncbi:MAG: response regulator transcription factor [Erythrobacter sp.]|nr:response regulator transcription factor [Erythrobacter sp.]
MSSPTCLIVGDVLLFREGLARGLGRLGNVRIADSVPSHDAADSIQEHSPDIVVLDISHLDTLETIRPLLHKQPDLSVVGFGIGGQLDALRCAERGISSFVGRDESIEDLDLAIQKAARGEAVCSPALTARLIRHMAALIDNAQVQTNNCLTAREREVATLVKRGMSNKEIAKELGISPATVKNHVHMILEKLNMPRRASIGMAV